MWVDGIEIERVEDNANCYIVDNTYFVVSNTQGDIMFVFNLEFQNKKLENFQKDIVQRTIFRYDIIKNIQDNCNS